MCLNTFISEDARHFTEFIKFKRSLGFKYTGQAYRLMSFDKYLYRSRCSCGQLTMEQIKGWTARRPNESELTRYGRIVLLKEFLTYLRNNGIATPIPMLPKYPTSTFVPHIYSDMEINAIFRECDRMRLEQKQMNAYLFIMPCMLRMLYATGIRIGEAISLNNGDLDLHEQYLTLHDTKNTKDRYVPFNESLTSVCKEYLRQRNALHINGAGEPGSPFFISTIGNRCHRENVEKWFRRILLQAGIPINANGVGPRLHDLRHTFACHSFAGLMRNGDDLYCSWPYLSAYLGHQSLRATEQYVRLTEQLYPELLEVSEQVYVEVLPDIVSLEGRRHERL